ncbi:family 16 glycosylhydrolase [Indioceanicola profundi]|uniref:family 16 glycosylhydrolase n=1 Tax=Indioceanicola profundi TaxID=2220096 RepID=UPI000E6AD7DA|nr:family 16 glycosylhydrolase [Indioceanicola profundi]
MSDQIDLSNYKLVFNEEFDSLRLLGTDGGLWKTTEYWGSRSLDGNGERQLYVDPGYKNLGLNPFRTDDGVLTIRAEKAPRDLKPLIENKDYTSGLISSEQAFSMQYGYFEMRAQLPEGKGLWSCFWMMGLDGEWPPEMDVVEVLGHEPDKLRGTYHYIDEEGKRVTEYAAVSKGQFDSSDGFHTYGVDWQEDKVVWYFDGVKIGETDNQVFNQPMYMIANLTVGGFWPGRPDANTKFPADMQIDYIRAYHKPLDQPVEGVPLDWTPVDMNVFAPVSGEGATVAATWDYSLAPTETAAILSGEKTRFLTGNDQANYLAGSDAPYNEILGGGGHDTLYGGLGADMFIIRDGDGSDTILDLSNSVGNTDKIRLEGFHFRHFEEVQAWLNQAGTDVVLRLDEDQALLMKDTTIAELTPEMFVFTDPVEGPIGGPVMADGPQTPVPALPGISLGTTEAEILALAGGYAAESRSQSSGGGNIKVTGSGEAEGAFSGPAGTYTLSIGFLNEADGASGLDLRINGETVQSWVGTGGSDALDVRSVQAALNPGDVVTIAGTQEGWEHARVDWLKIEEIAPPNVGLVGAAGTPGWDGLG